jgi:hypothetical protein
VGYGDDRYRPSQYLRGPFGGDAFRANQGVTEGSYLRSAAVVEWGRLLRGRKQWVLRESAFVALPDGKER